MLSVHRPSPMPASPRLQLRIPQDNPIVRELNRESHLLLWSVFFCHNSLILDKTKGATDALSCSLRWVNNILFK